jgi:hypothetical protein
LPLRETTALRSAKAVLPPYLSCSLEQRTWPQWQAAAPRFTLEAQPPVLSCI